MPSTWFSIQALAGLLLQTTNALELPDYTALKTYQNASVLEITLHNPKSPLNLWSQDIQSGLTDIVQRLQVDNETKVVIFKSDVPRFFSAHLDLLMPGVGKWDSDLEEAVPVEFGLLTVRTRHYRK